MRASNSNPSTPKEQEPESLDTLIRRSIRQGRYVPGQRLVEIDLKNQFGASQRQVRDTLLRLETEGLVSIEKNRGASVRMISQSEVSCILDVLDSLSLLAVSKAATQIDTPGHRTLIIKSLKAAKQFREHAKTEKSVQKYLDENVRFWDSIAAVVDNPVLWETRERLETLLYRLQVRGLSIKTDPDKWITRHEGILMAILDGDANLAEKLTLEASVDIREAILALGDEVFT